MRPVRLKVSPPPLDLRNPESVLYELAIERPEDLDLDIIARFYNASIEYERLSGMEANILGINGRAIITVNDVSGVARQRFSIAHELGHWVFDRDAIGIACTQRSYFEEWARESTLNVEQRANRYAADLLLPKSMFVPRARHQPITLDSAAQLASLFQTSLTCTAIRLVEYGSYSGIVYCTKAGNRPNSWRRRWFSRSSDLPESLWPREIPGSDTVAADLMANRTVSPSPTEVSASQWLEHPGAHHCTVFESSARISENLILSLLWWKNPDQLLALVGDDEDLLYE